MIVTRDEALARGLKHYFTGVPCRNGHIEKRLARTRHCLGCCRKNAAAHRERDPDGTRTTHLKYRERHADELRARGREYDQRNRESRRAKSQEWYRKNKAAIAARHARRYYAHQAEYLAKAALRREANRDRVRDSNSKWAKNNRAKCNAKRHNREARIRGTGEVYTASDVAEIMRLQRGKCAYCRVKLTKARRSIDHIIPVARGGRNARTNIQILCGSCNSKKGARDPIDYAQAMGMLL